jgi:glucosamine-6-phosphate deaminase
MAEVVLVPRRREAGEVAAHAISALIAAKPDAVLGVATGSTPLTTYEALAARVKRDAIDVSRVRVFALDEYIGLPIDHPESYRSVIRREVTEQLGLDPTLVNVPDGSLDGVLTAGDAYEAAIVAAGGVDVQLLGIGTTGHIGFNEPGSSFASTTRWKTLTEQTRIDNARFFSSIDDVPTHCITQGLGTILRARHLILLAFGASKADAVAGAVEGPVTSSLPGSAIQLHPHVTVIVDEEAASAFAHADYYRHAWALRIPGVPL